MDCHLFRLLIQKYHDGELEPAEMAKFQAHLADCAQCAALEAEYHGVFEALDGIGYQEPSPGFNEAVMAQIDTGKYRKSAARKFATAISWKWNLLPGYVRVTGALALVFALFMYIFRPIFHLFITGARNVLAFIGSAVILFRETGKLLDTVVNYFKSDPEFILAARIIIRKIHNAAAEMHYSYMIGTVLLTIIMIYFVARMSRSSWRKGESNAGSI